MTRKNGSGHRPPVNTYHAINLHPWGSGGYGDLQSGWCPELGIPVVVKRLRDHRPAARKAFEREIRIHSKDRPGCIRNLFWNLRSTPPWYAMPLMSGGPLTRWAGMLSPDRLHNVALELARTVSQLHSDFITHGDFKPDNILVGDNGHLNVADPLGSGIGCTFLFSENSGGTKGYWAPEVAQGGPISQAADVFSYGATLYHMVTGTAPIDGQNLDPVANGYAVSAVLREVIVNCCQPDPALRPSMGDVIRMLRGERLANIRAQRRETVQIVVLGSIAIVALFAIGHALSEAA
jgi:serine/threonine protein kinase